MDDVTFATKLVPRLSLEARCHDVPGDVAGLIIATGGDHHRTADRAHLVTLLLTSDSTRELAEGVLRRYGSRPIVATFALPSRFDGMPQKFKEVRLSSAEAIEAPLRQALAKLRGQLAQAEDAGLIPTVESVAIAREEGLRGLDADIARLEKLKSMPGNGGIPSSWLVEQLGVLRAARAIALRIDPNVHSCSRYVSGLSEELRRFSRLV